MSDNLHLEKVIGVNGNMITVEFTAEVMQNEVAYVHVGGSRLKSEVIRRIFNNFVALIEK